MDNQKTQRFNDGLSVRRQVLGPIYVDNAFAVHHHHGGQLDVAAHGSQAFDENPLALLDPVLLSTSGDHCVHSAVRLSGAIDGATASRVTVTCSTVQYRSPAACPT